jgi:hypothetical protein
MRMLPWKDMKLCVFLILLVGIFASGSALAVVRVIEVGSLGRGDPLVGLFGHFPVGVESTDIYEFSLERDGPPGEEFNYTVGASLASLLTIPFEYGGSAPRSFDMTVELLEWNGTTFQNNRIRTGAAVFLLTSLKAGGRYQLTVTGTPTGRFHSAIASYGGSLAVVPEPSMAVLLIGGFFSLAFLSRRRLR